MHVEQSSLKVGRYFRISPIITYPIFFSLSLQRPRIIRLEEYLIFVE